MGSFFLSLILVLSALLQQVWCQSVQDDWTAPAAPDGSTPLQSGTKFTLLWKSGLQNSFEAYCPSCDTKNLDLWITNFNGTKYTSKIGRGIDITRSTSYDWNVNIASEEFSGSDFWVFRFTFFDSPDPYEQQVSSPGFKISGLSKASSTTSAVSHSASIAATSSSVSSSSTSTPQSSESNTPAKNNAWIAGVVVGPIVGIALGAALVWFCLRKHRKEKAAPQFGEFKPLQTGRDTEHQPLQDIKRNSFEGDTGGSQSWPHQAGHPSEHMAEAPGSTGLEPTKSPQIAEVSGNNGPQEPAELWQGNYEERKR